jgi:DNA modification methylase
VTSRIPYSQQFTPEQTPLKRLLAVLRQNAGDSAKLKRAIAGAFFKDKASPEKLAGNTLISLKTYGIIDADCALAPFGKEMLALQDDLSGAHALLAKRILVEMNGISIVETLREMAAGGIKIELKSLPDELAHRGIDASNNSSDLSGVLGWLREARVLVNKYEVSEPQYAALMGAPSETLLALKNLNSEQISFLRAMVALSVTDWTPYNAICRHAEALYSGEILFNWKDIVKLVLQPLQTAGLIEIRKKAKQDQNTPEGRGGKATDVKPTGKFEKEIAEPLLGALYKAAGYTEIRAIRSKPLEEIVKDMEGADTNKSGKALEFLAIRLCQLLDLNFLGWRETDEEVAGGGEVDALLHSARLTYSRWQVQCKVGKITLSAVSKEVGMKDVTLANVILVAGTKKATDSALTYRQKIVSTSNLNIVIIDGPLLQTIIKDQTQLVNVLRRQAENALRMKPSLQNIKTVPPSGGGDGPVGGFSEPEPAKERPKSEKPIQQSFELAYATKLGKMFSGDSLAILPHLIDQGVRVKLIVTSPPFALVRKKDYGNKDAGDYLQWFAQFTQLFKEILTPDGSVVIDIGGAWIKGLPCKSTYHFKLLLNMCEGGFHLAQDFYHYNPARLPTPAEWVTVRRLRVKDAVNNVWWLTLDPFVKSDNRKVLRPYSESMKGLLKNGYKAQMRPSGHDISTKFQKDNNGSIPPNLLEFANTESNSHYLRRCKELNIKPHPARFPQALPEFFINFLTEPGDLVLDPFGGSNVTGAAAESLGRKWISIEMEHLYVRASQFRFEKQKITESASHRSGPVTANLFPPEGWI